MPELSAFDYAIVRVVPRVERGEFINVGVILTCPKQSYLEARIELDEARLRALSPTCDLEEVRRHLDAIPRVARGGFDAGPIGQLPQRERWHWLSAPRSSVVQVSPAHSGLCTDPAAELERLMETVVRVRAAPERT